MTKVRITVALKVLAIAMLVGACSTNRTVKKTPLGKYYIDFTEVAKNWDGPFDEHGIPMRDYGSTFGVQYQPAGIAHYALGNLDLYLDTGEVQYKNEFLKMADWFCTNLVRKDTFGVWEYRFDYPRYYLKAPWPSAMSQGEGISVLARAYQLTKNEKYLQCATLALASFSAPLERGGLRFVDYAGFVWYEEYPSVQAPPHVLNGFIFALYGLYDFSKLIDSELALDLFNEGIETLKANLYRYDLGFWSRYNLIEPFREHVFLFRFVTDQRHPRYPHPIDRIMLHITTESGERSQVTLDVGVDGDKDDIDVNRARLYYSPSYQDWGDPYILDGRTVRYYENLGGRYAHAPFEFLMELEKGNTHKLEVVYKDIHSEPVYVEMYADGVKYIRVGQLETIGDGEWKATAVELPTDLLLFKTGASLRYHELHIQQLEVLGKITEEPIFLAYAEVFEAYQQVVVGNLWWHDIVSSVKRGLRNGE